MITCQRVIYVNDKPSQAGYSIRVRVIVCMFLNTYR